MWFSRPTVCLGAVWLVAALGRGGEADLPPAILLSQCKEFIGTNKREALQFRGEKSSVTIPKGTGPLTKARVDLMLCLYIRPKGIQPGQASAALYREKLKGTANKIDDYAKAAHALCKRVEDVVARVRGEVDAFKADTPLPKEKLQSLRNYIVRPQKGLPAEGLTRAGSALQEALGAENGPAARQALQRVYGAWWQLAELLRWSALTLDWLKQDLMLTAGFMKTYPNYEYAYGFRDTPGILDAHRRQTDIETIIFWLKVWLKRETGALSSTPVTLHAMARDPYNKLLGLLADVPRAKAALIHAAATPYEALILSEQMLQYHKAGVLEKLPELCRRWARSTAKSDDLAIETRTLMDVLCERQGSTETGLKTSYRFHKDLVATGEMLCGKSRTQAFEMLEEAMRKRSSALPMVSLYARICKDEALAREIFGKDNTACYRASNLFAVSLANAGFAGVYPFLDHVLRPLGKPPSRHNVVGFDLQVADPAGRDRRDMTLEDHRVYSESGLSVLERTPISVSASADGCSWAHAFYRSVSSCVAERYYLPPNKILIRAVPYYNQKNEKVETVASVEPER